MTPRPADDEFVAWFKTETERMTNATRKVVAMGEEFAPAIFIYPMDAKESVAVIPVAHFFGSITGKEIVSALHHAMAEDELVATAMLATEAWVLSGEVGEISMNQDIRTHPNRKEAMVFNAVRKGMQLIAAYIIDRENKTIAEKPQYIMDSQAGMIDDKKGRAEGGFSIGRMVVGDEERRHKPKH